MLVHLLTHKLLGHVSNNIFLWHLQERQLDEISALLDELMECDKEHELMKHEKEIEKLIHGHSKQCDVTRSSMEQLIEESETKQEKKLNDAIAIHSKQLDVTQSTLSCSFLTADIGKESPYLPSFYLQ